VLHVSLDPEEYPMATRNLLAALFAVALGACGNARTEGEPTRTDGPLVRHDADKVTDKVTDVDNTARNDRDRDGSTPTPLDQSESAADIKITADIRQAIMQDGTLSMNAQNCKIITNNGITTLRGVVASDAERKTIEAKAVATPGVVRVDNQLEIKAE
jgi:osmotically-inducible protein OsmY